MADRDKKSGVADIEILGWVGDVGEVVLADYFFGRVGVFRDAFGITIHTIMYIGFGEESVV